MEINEFRNLMISLSKGLRKWAPDFSDETTVKIWYPSFKDISPENLKTACRLAIDTLTEFPSVKELKELCFGNILKDSEVGQDIAAKIERSMTAFGYMRPNEVREYIGELAWDVVRICGGWQAICMLEYDQMPAARKQWREQASILFKKHRHLGEDAPIAIPKQSNSVPLQNAIAMISNLVTTPGYS